MRRGKNKAIEGCLAALRIWLREIFYFSALALAIFTGLEIIWPKIILNYFNLNYLVFVVILSGLGQLVWPPTGKENN